MDDHHHIQIELEGVPVDLLLTDTEVKIAAARAIDMPQFISSTDSAGCWPIDTPKKKCGILKWIMGRCCDCNTCN
tara:strand:- start:497 stop:721 length:225 start_codon:yes stop_codon:yes gene_type:complete